MAQKSIVFPGWGWERVRLLQPTVVHFLPDMSVCGATVLQHKMAALGCRRMSMASVGGIAACYSKRPCGAFIEKGSRSLVLVGWKLEAVCCLFEGQPTGHSNVWRCQRGFVDVRRCAGENVGAAAARRRWAAFHALHSGFQDHKVWRL